MTDKTLEFSKDKFAKRTTMNNDLIAIVRETTSGHENVVYLTEEEIKRLYEAFCK